MSRKETFNVIVANDETLTRQATIRILEKAAKNHNIKLNIISSSDGLETIFLIYKSLNMGISISFVLSDENMNFINGLESSNILCRIVEKNKLRTIPFFLLSADDLNPNRLMLPGKIIRKPLSLEKAEELLLNPKK
jgi:hypothetical protein